MKYRLKENLKHKHDRQNNACEKYLTARLIRYHVFQTQSSFLPG